MQFNLSKNDFYTQKAKDQGYPARSVYKLQEIDKKFRILKAGDRVLDLGASPGSWLLYISQKIGDKGKVIGVDTDDLKIDLPANAIFIKKSVFEQGLVPPGSDPGAFDVIVSDLAPKTTGLHERDTALCLELAQKALEIARQCLVADGSFVCKLFEGEEMADFEKDVKEYFSRVKFFKPKASQKQSREIYLVAKNYVKKYSSKYCLVIK